MLLKQSNPEHATNSIGIDATTLENSDSSHETIIHMDPLADVFGTDTGGGAGAADDDSDDGFNDVFYNDNQQDDHRDNSNNDNTSHPSDIRRLQQEHVTAGYRDGITVAKASSIQAGFDEGFSLGATIGLKVGQLLGMLEGIVAAVTGGRASGSTGADSGSLNASELASAESPDAMSHLLSLARAELGVRSVFGQTYWHSDGTWKYDVDGETSATSKDNGKDNENDDAEVLFSHVAEAHPLVKKWTSIIEAQTRKWGIDEHLALLQRKSDHSAVGEAAAAAAATHVEPMAKPTKVTTQGGPKAPNDALSW